MCAVAVGTGSASTWQFKGWATMSYTGISGGNTLTGTSLISGSGQLVNEGNPFWYNSPVVNLSFSLSGATAPYTFQFPFDTYFKVTTAGSISSLTFNKNLIATSLTVGTVYFVPAGTKVTLAAPSSATSFANPPVFQITPT
jgi:hypothetical protein